MAQQGQGQYHGSGRLSSNPRNTNEGGQIMGNPSQGPVLTPSSASLLSVQTAGSQLPGQLVSFQQMQQKRDKEMGERLKSFWANQSQDIKNTTDFKSHSLPLARIKKIMKADEDVKMISSEAPIVFAKACEMFIMDLTMRAWHNTEENKRRTLQRADVTSAIARTDIFDFLVDIIPKEDVKDEPLFSMPRNVLPVTSMADSQTYFHVPPQQPAIPRAPGDNMNSPVMDPNFFRQHIPYTAPMLWYSQAQEEQQLHQHQHQQHQSPSDS